MEHLIPELLGHIASFLDPLSLDAFSRTNKRCRAVSLRYVFSTINIKFSCPKQFHVSIYLATMMLEATQSWNLVSHLQVLSTDGRAWQHGYPDNYDDVWTRPHEDRSNVSITKQWGHKIIPLVLNTEWSNLCNLVRNLPALRDLTWNVLEVIPLELLSYMHSVHHMRLRMPQGIFRSQHFRDTTQLEHLAQSSCLYSMDYRPWFDLSLDFGERVLLGTVAAGTLKQLYIRGYYYAPQDGSTTSDLDSVDPWQPKSVHFERTGALESLFLQGGSVERILRRLSHCTDLSLLQSLSLYCTLQPTTIQWLRECDFPSLSRLTIGWQEELVDAAFITSLPSLGHLYLYDEYDEESLYTIMKQCAGRLRSLHCKANFINGDIIAALSQSCGLIESLGFCMFRKAGSPAELAIYRELGRLPALEHVELQYHSYEILPDSSETDGLSHILRDIALDRHLASSVFRAIARAKPLHAVPFETLRLSTAVSGQAQNLDEEYLRSLSKLFDYIGSPWTCRRYGSASGGQVFTARHGDFYDRRAPPVLELGGYRGLTISDATWESIYRAWPAAFNSPLETAWHSFPLYDGVTN